MTESIQIGKFKIQRPQSIQIGSFQIQQSEVVSLLQTYQLLPNVVRELVIDRAIAEIECSEEEKFTALKYFYESNELSDEDRLTQWANNYYLERQQIADIAIRQFKIEKFKRVKFGVQVESYFLKRKSQLDKAVYSLIRTTDPGIAQEIYFRSLDNPQSFGELARQYSQGPESQTGGTIGPIELSQPHPAIAHLLATQPVGRVCQPIPLDRWYVLVRPEQIVAAQLDEPMRQRLLNEMFQTWVREQMQLAMI